MSQFIRKIGFKIKNEMKLHDKVPKLIGILTVIRCILGPNLENLTSIGDDLSRGQAENGVFFVCVFFNFKFNLILKVNVNESQIHWVSYPRCFALLVQI